MECMTTEPKENHAIQKVNTETSGPSLHAGRVLKKQMLTLTISLKVADVVCVKFSFHMKLILMRNRQEWGQVKLKITNVSNTKLTAERRLGSKSPESSFCYFLVIEDLFQTRRCSQASDTPLRNICRHFGRSWPGKGGLRRMKLIYLY